MNTYSLKKKKKQINFTCLLQILLFMSTNKFLLFIKLIIEIILVIL
jgi:hypothetical protein